MTHFGKMCLSLPRVSRVLHGGSSRSGVACHLRARQFSLTAGRRRPMCVVQTNLTDSDIPTDLTTQLSHLLSTMLNKPLDNITVSIQSGCRMSRQGTQEPTALVQIWSVGVFSPELNPRYRSEVFSFLMPHLNLTENRIAVIFHPIAKSDMGLPD